MAILQRWSNDPITPSESLKYKIKITGKTLADGNTKDVKIAITWKYLSHFWKTIEMPLINCEINLIWTWSEDCAISSTTGETKFKITDTKRYVPVVTLSIQDNAKLLQQLNEVLKEQLTGTNIKQKYQQKE